jgi:hypothetical protein
VTAATAAAAAAAAVLLQTIMRGRLFPRSMRLSTDGTNTEACLTLVNSSAPGTPVFNNFANLRVVRRNSNNSSGKSSSSSSGIPGDGTVTLPNPAAAAAAAAAAGKDSKPATRSSTGASTKTINVAYDGAWNDSSRMRTAAPTNLIPQQQQQQQQQQYATALPAPDLDVAGQYSWLQQAIAAVPPPSNPRLAAKAVAAAYDADSAAASTWEALQRRYKWPDGQYSLASMWSPYDSEDIGDCEQCQAQLW